ncbi:hypothetical protein CP061683_0283B, partial [Chlamydia psittaci 06-1683]
GFSCHCDPKILCVIFPAACNRGSSDLIAVKVFFTSAKSSLRIFGGE